MFQPVVMMLALGLSTVANGQKSQPASVYPLRYVGADDVVKTLDAYRVGRQKLAFRATFDARTNLVIVAGDPAHVKQVVALIASLDVAPPQVLVQMTILEAPANFADDIGLGDGYRWVLTPREAKMLAASIHSRHGKEVDILSRPQLLLTENQQGFFQAGSSDAAHVVRITPRIMPDGASHMLRFEAEHAKQTMPGVQNTTAISTTETVPVSNTLFLRGGCTKVGDKVRGVFYIVTVHKVVNADR